MVIVYPTKLFGWAMIILFAISSALFIGSQIVYTGAYVDTEMSLMLPAVLSDEHKSDVKTKSSLREIKGIYLTAYSAGSSKKIDEIIRLIDRTELNAVVIDIKDYSGLIFYDSQVPLVKELKLKEKRLGDIKALIDKLHRHKIYVIARQSVFQDPLLAEKKNDWAIKNKNGGLWRDNKGLAWVDAAKKEVWDYNILIAKEAVALGFDEINFDYVRFPSDGKMSEMVYSGGEKKKYQIMAEFYAYVSRKLVREPAWISIDMFGLVMEKSGEDDMAIGQRIVDANNQVDYICPMMYPSHYPSGHLGLKNPADHPFEVLDNGMNKGMTMFQNTRAQPRPWLQAFNLGADYDATKIREQIDAVEKYASAGWLLWNASNRYSDAGLKLN
ncbi:MAG: sugar fermentation stimulation protein [Candidatus Magasanikbacteria bacterium CG10_big_fil_rev_8_21_14_0_10_36_32]|uniref:Sugar fermentation stimulation protein n=1 Tax=Candidatus Magasanikbacteria bacterium CG10_big_fil_rev_8_21_14_0_10_36_32 TaxID=1974646 RepID=A0A2M6W7G6_9BACT|nr:MAG: sugar fermentation stimulation protein [Candidatus Magasanikbacteria bacterium CG10_big_fil_rev_8_21_14_0_10_36_32]